MTNTWDWYKGRTKDCGEDCPYYLQVRYQGTFPPRIITDEACDWGVNVKILMPTENPRKCEYIHKENPNKRSRTTIDQLRITLQEREQLGNKRKARTERERQRMHPNQFQLPLTSRV